MYRRLRLYGALVAWKERRSVPDKSVCRRSGNDSRMSGIAIEIADGDLSALYAMAVAVLMEVGLADDENAPGLTRRDNPKLRNIRGIEVGRLETIVHLSRSSGDGEAREAASIGSFLKDMLTDYRPTKRPTSPNCSRIGWTLAMRSRGLTLKSCQFGTRLAKAGGSNMPRIPLMRSDMKPRMIQSRGQTDNTRVLFLRRGV